MNLADILPAAVRKTVYAVLAVIVPLVTLLVVLLRDGWQPEDLILIVTSLTSSAGFGMATGNTPATFKHTETTSTVIEEPRDAGAISVGEVLFVALVAFVVAILVVRFW